MARTFESWLKQEVQQCLWISNTWPTTLHPQSDGMVEQYVKIAEEHLRRAISTHQWDWDKRLPIFLLAYRASAWETTGMISVGMVFGRDLCLLCDLLFGSPLTRSSLKPTTRETLWTGCMTSIIMPVSIWRCAMTARPVTQDFRKVMKSGCTTWSRPGDHHQSSSQPTQAYTRWSPIPVTWPTTPSDIWEQRLW